MTVTYNERPRSKLQLERAHGMVVVTDSDLVNLEAAWAAQAARPALPVAVHVADLTLLRPPDHCQCGAYMLARSAKCRVRQLIGRDWF